MMGWEMNVTMMMTMMGSQMRNLQALTTVGLSLTLAKKTRTVGKWVHVSSAGGVSCSW